MLDLRRDLEPYEKVLAILSLLFFPPALIAFVTWEKADAQGKSGKLFMIIAVSIILTFYFFILTSAANNAALDYSRPEAMPAFWWYIHVITKPLFDIFGQWISYAIVFVVLVIAGLLICRLVARSHGAVPGKELESSKDK